MSGFKHFNSVSCAMDGYNVWLNLVEKLGPGGVTKLNKKDVVGSYMVSISNLKSIIDYLTQVDEASEKVRQKIRENMIDHAYRTVNREYALKTNDKVNEILAEVGNDFVAKLKEKDRKIMMDAGIWGYDDDC